MSQSLQIYPPADSVTYGQYNAGSVYVPDSLFPQSVQVFWGKEMEHPTYTPLWGMTSLSLPDQSCNLKTPENRSETAMTVEEKSYSTWSTRKDESWSHSTRCHKEEQNGMQVILARHAQYVPSWSPVTDQSQGSLLCRRWSASVTWTNQNAVSSH